MSENRGYKLKAGEIHIRRDGSEAPDAYLSIAQSKSEGIWGNILRIPKVSIVEIITLGVFIFLIIFTVEKFSAIKDAILAYFP